MKDRSPCISCRHRSPGCQGRCEIGRHFWAKMREKNERIREERAKEIDFTAFKVDQVAESKKRAGR